MKIENKILSTELVEWKRIKWFQNKNLKKLNKDNLQKLKNSFIKNNFVMPFHVWKKNKDEWYFLDGHHRQIVLLELEKEGYDLPKLLPANIVKCANEKEAAELVLLYSSTYAKITDNGLSDFIKSFDIDIKEVEKSIELANIDLNVIDIAYIAELEEPKFKEKNVILTYKIYVESKYNDVFQKQIKAIQNELIQTLIIQKVK